jgi:hypothetical protein
MAHIGCYVTANEFTMTGVDRIFTKLGVRDDILQVFFVLVDVLFSLLLFSLLRASRPL